MLANEKSGAKDVANVIESDVGISAKVLHLVNTAFFGASAQINAVDAAVARLGVNVVKSVVLSAEVSRAFQVAPAHAALMDSVTEDSLRVARVAQAVTRHMVSGPTAAAVASDAFMAGLLHQVGLLVLAAKAPARLLELAKLRASSEE
nr:HDOD domain-containing protein [Polyangiaceae bacterium]